MPSSTTLETLVLEINSSAKGADEGIGRTVGSLRSLARAIGTVLPGLREINRELRNISKIKMPKVGGSITSGAKRTSAASSIMDAVLTEKKAPYGIDPQKWYSMSQADQRVFEKVYRYQYHQQQLAEQQRRQAEVAERRRQFSESMNTNSGANAIVQEAKNHQELAKGIKKVGEEAEKSKTKVSGWAKLWSTIGRIFKTMLIRTAIRSVIKAFSESWNAVYEFSNHLGGSFATSVDAAKTLLYDMATTIIQTVAPVFEALVPVIKVVADAISYLCTGIQQLLKLLGLTSDVTGAATSKINKYIDSAGKGGKATKNMLASWDQLNVIQSKGSSGSGGASYNPGALSKLVNAETNAITQMLVGETLVAVGLILACTGHIGVGVGMMAVGGAAIAKTLTEDWNKLPREIKKTITNIMGFAGSSMLALGLIVMSANPALGIGMIVAGLANLGLAVGLNWDEIVAEVRKVISSVRDWFVEKWGDIKNAAIGAWGSIQNWWTTNVVENMEKEGAWGGVKGFFKGVFNTVKDSASTAWTILNDFMDDNIGISFRSAWGEVQAIFKSVFGSTEQPDTVVGMIHGAFQDASEWWNTNITENFNKGWDSLPEFFKNIFGSTEQPDTVVGWIHGAWQNVSEWWTTNVSDKVKEEGAWGGVKGFFEGLWGDTEKGTGISGMFSRMWDNISILWGDVVGLVKGAWESVAEWFNTNITRPISDFFINMINRIVDGLNWLIDGLNSIGRITIPGVIDQQLFSIPHVEYVAFGANGLYDVPAGDLFVANEAGAELVGSMNGKTTVANQQQIVEGIQKGVAEANQSQNELLRQQNELLRAILQKKNDIRPSAAWGSFAEKSINLWNGMTGG